MICGLLVAFLSGAVYLAFWWLMGPTFDWENISKGEGPSKILPMPTQFLQREYEIAYSRAECECPWPENMDSWQTCSIVIVAAWDFITYKARKVLNKVRNHKVRNQRQVRVKWENQCYRVQMLSVDIFYSWFPGGKSGLLRIHCVLLYLLFWIF